MKKFILIALSIVFIFFSVKLYAETSETVDCEQICAERVDFFQKLAIMAGDTNFDCDKEMEKCMGLCEQGQEQETGMSNDSNKWGCFIISLPSPPELYRNHF